GLWPKPHGPQARQEGGPRPAEVIDRARVRVEREIARLIAELHPKPEIPTRIEPFAPAASRRAPMHANGPAAPARETVTSRAPAASARETALSRPPAAPGAGDGDLASAHCW